MENEREKQQFEEGSPQAESGEVEAGNAETSYAGPVAGSTGDWEETESACRGWDRRCRLRRAPLNLLLPNSSPTRPARRRARAANAMRRGEFMHSAAVDISADGDDRLIALLCYVTQALIPLIMPILVLLSASSKKRPFQRFHAVQSLALSLTFILFGLLMGVGSTILALVPVIGWLVVIVVFCLSPLLVLMGFMALAYYGYQAYQGKRFAIPGLTSFLQDQDWI